MAPSDRAGAGVWGSLSAWLLGGECGLDTGTRLGGKATACQSLWRKCEARAEAVGRAPQEGPQCQEGTDGHLGPHRWERT